MEVERRLEDHHSNRGDAFGRHRRSMKSGTNPQRISPWVLDNSDIADQVQYASVLGASLRKKELTRYYYGSFPDRLDIFEFKTSETENEAKANQWASDSLILGPSKAVERKRKALLSSLSALVEDSYWRVAQEEKAALEAENRELTHRIRFMSAQVRKDRLPVQFYTLGAAGVFVSLISLVFFAATGIGAPLHPTFAVFVLPVSVALIGMAFLVKREESKKSEKKKAFN